MIYMNVKQLKELLNSLPDDTEICVESDISLNNPWINKVLPISDTSIKRVKDYKIAARPCKETKDAKITLILHL